MQMPPPTSAGASASRAAACLARWVLWPVLLRVQRVLDLVTGLVGHFLGFALTLINLALSFQALVVGHLAGGFLRFALHLVEGAHSWQSSLSFTSVDSWLVVPTVTDPVLRTDQYVNSHYFQIQRSTHTLHDRFHGGAHLGHGHRMVDIHPHPQRQSRGLFSH